MSEEKIIEIIEELQCDYKEQENEQKYNFYTVYKAKKYSKALQGLLDLYIKLKEKYIDKDFISKDEIRELSDKYENEIEKGGVLTKINQYNLLRVVINDLEELLGE